MPKIIKVDDRNSLAYNDVLDREEPRLPNDLEYMRHYRAWQKIANWPEDIIEPE